MREKPAIARSYRPAHNPPGHIGTAKHLALSGCPVGAGASAAESQWFVLGRDGEHLQVSNDRRSGDYTCQLVRLGSNDQGLIAASSWGFKSEGRAQPKVHANRGRSG